MWVRGVLLGVPKDLAVLSHSSADLGGNKGQVPEELPARDCPVGCAILRVSFSQREGAGNRVLLAKNIIYNIVTIFSFGES